MRSGVLGFISTALLFGSVSALAQEEPKTPRQVRKAQAAVVTQEFTIDGKSYGAGTGFVARLLDTNLLVTAHHLFGEAGGMPIEYTAESLAKSGVRVQARSSTSVLLESSKPLAIPGATGSGQTTHYDVAAFLLTSVPKKVDAVRFSSSTPKKGDRVFLLLLGTDGLELYPASVIQKHPMGLAFVFDGKPELAGSSGAPIVDERGEVVGINIAGGTTADGRAVGFANPTSSAAKMLERALNGRRAGGATPARKIPSAARRPR